MQIHRLFEMIYILLDKRKITARELADRFEVSERTVYRDVEVLSSAGIPIYATKGKGGGISLLEDFVLNKSVLSESEQNEILFGLKGLAAVQAGDSDEVLRKLSSLFRKEDPGWIEVDFSSWGSGPSEREKFDLLKAAILSRRQIDFDYYSSYGIKTTRVAEPAKLCFKNSSWYLQAYCPEKTGFRTFKIRRMEKVQLLENYFVPHPADGLVLEGEPLPREQVVQLELIFPPRSAYRVFDTFHRDQIRQNEDGSFHVSVWYPENDWVYGFLLSFGEDVQVISPPHIKRILRDKAQAVLDLYSSAD